MDARIPLGRFFNPARCRVLFAGTGRATPVCGGSSCTSSERNDMSVASSLWSYIAQWLGYVVWCASASDAACRPFIGFLALAGASAGALT